jgi:hypothetical protein
VPDKILYYYQFIFIEIFYSFSDHQYACIEGIKAIKNGKFSTHQITCPCCQYSWYWTNSFPYNFRRLNRQSHLRQIPLDQKGLAILIGQNNSKN